jgi:hypothetical protein
MSKSICTRIRRELDEMRVDQECSGEVTRHLNECSKCRDFHQKQTRLLQIVGGLGTVSAPPDFDFRLRSRLANENSTSSFHLTHSFLTFGQRSVVAATALALLVGAVVLVRNIGNRTPIAPVVVDKKLSGNGEPGAPAVAQPSERHLVVKDGREILSAAPTANGPSGKRNVSNALRPKRSTVATDYSQERATVIGGPQSSGTIFPIDASQQSLRVSLFDGRGNPRTISLPPVSFGSQRVVPTANSFAPRGVW